MAKREDPAVIAALMALGEALGYHVVKRDAITHKGIRSIAARGVKEPDSMTPDDIMRVCGSVLSQSY